MKTAKMSDKIEAEIEESIDGLLQLKDEVFVLFYASWCPFSQRFLPIFEQCAKDAPQECRSVMIDYKPDLCEKYSIDYYPTVLLFKNGLVYRRLDATPGVGLNRRQLIELMSTQ
jgi:thiol-disulfide isomerase/thioredoxin